MSHTTEGQKFTIAEYEAIYGEMEEKAPKKRLDRFESNLKRMGHCSECSSYNGHEDMGEGIIMSWCGIKCTLEDGVINKI